MMLKKVAVFVLVVFVLVVVIPQKAAISEIPTSGTVESKSAYERIADVSRQLEKQRRARSLTELMGALLVEGGVLSITFLFPDKKDRLNYLIIVTSLFFIAIYPNYARATSKYLEPTPIENDYKKLSLLPINNYEKEEQSFTILKNNVAEAQKPEGAYSFYKKRHWFFPHLGPDIDTGLIKLNYEEYLKQVTKEGYSVEKE